MTTARQNDLLTRVGPGTPMGELMRQYWIPAAKSAELVADGDPVRLLLLGEKLIAFRDTSGRIGVMDHRCPHRCASFFFGRNEEDGIRCVYHGWKFDTLGNCVDMPNVPPHQDFKHKVKAKAYRAVERNGLVWVYMGPRADPPPLPDIEATLLPEGAVDYHFVLRECNWLQAAEGEFDTSHVGFLHFGAARREQYESGDMSQYVVAERAPSYVAEDTDYGVIYGAHRPGDEGQTYWRVGQFLFPFWAMPPIEHIGRNLRARAYVPLDDAHAMVVMVFKKPEFSEDAEAQRRRFAGATQNYDVLPPSTDWLGRYRRVDNAANDYHIDREVQRTRSYTGIDGVQLQDQALQESMGAIVDRSFEHLAPSDIMITQVRRRLIRAANALAKDGAIPPGVDRPEAYGEVRGGFFQAPESENWRAAYSGQLADAPPAVAEPMVAE